MNSAGDDTQHIPRAISAQISGIPAKLMVRAVELCRQHGLSEPSEAHLIAAALERPSLARLLEDIELDSEGLRSAVEPRLDVSPPPFISITEVSAGGLAVATYGGVIAIEARATVLAAAPQPHAVDDVDVFVAALFDPHSLVSHWVSLEAEVERVSIVEHIRQSTERYIGVVFPRSLVVPLTSVVRVPWALRDEIVLVLRRELPTGVFWMCRRDADELVIKSDSPVVSAVLESEGYGGG